MTIPLNSWRPPPPTVALRHHEIHVWLAALNPDTRAIQRLEQTLDGDERAQAARFPCSAHRDQYIASHGMLRAILGRYLDIAPAEVQLEPQAHGKPALAPRMNPHGVQFNMSHSHGAALCGVTRGREVGVDIEQERDEADITEISERFFSDGELHALRVGPEAIKRQAFFQIWTRKEAILKARGDGLDGLKRLGSLFVSSQCPARWELKDGPRHWVVQDLPAIKGYAAAVATEGRDVELCCWRWA